MKSVVLSLEEMANSFCLLMANAYRLIEDGEKLSAARRHTGAVGSFQAAVLEIIRGHLIAEAVLLEDDDADGWDRFWEDQNDRARLLRILEDQIHDKMYRDQRAHERYQRGLSLLPLEFVRISFDGRLFLPPGGDLAGHENIEAAARSYYEYVMGLFHAFNFYGLPNPATQIQTFWGLRMAARNAKLVG